MRRYRILTLAKIPVALGGAERLAVDIAIRLDRERFDRYYVATGTTNSPTRIDELVEAGVTFVQLRRRWRFDPLAWIELARLLRRERIDVLHSHLFGSNVWGAVLGRIARVPVIIAHEHTWSYEGQPLRRLVDRHVVGRLCDRFLAVSEADRDKMRDVVGIPESKIVVVDNGVDLAPPSGAPIRETLGIPTDVPVIVMVAVLRRQKRHDRLFDALAIVRRRYPDVHLLVVGNGVPELERAAKEQVARLGLDRNVRLLGVRRDIPDLLAASDVGVLTSDFEGSPLAVMEYMRAGLATVCTSVGGVPALIEDGSTGVLVHELSAEAVATAILELLDDPERAFRIGEAAREEFSRRFSLDAMLRQLESLYLALLEEGEVGRRGDGVD